MDELTTTETTNECEPEAKPADGGEVVANEPEPEQALTPAPVSLEQMVREAIDRRIAELFPPRKEHPRVEAAPGEMPPELRLRLGYGTREPNT